MKLLDEENFMGNYIQHLKHANMKYINIQDKNIDGVVFIEDETLRQEQYKKKSIEETLDECISIFSSTKMGNDHPIDNIERHYKLRDENKPYDKHIIQANEICKTINLVSNKTDDDIEKQASKEIEKVYRQCLLKLKTEFEKITYDEKSYDEKLFGYIKKVSEMSRDKFAFKHTFM
jgi:hypothetical protein